MDDYYDLSYAQVASAALLIGINGVISFALRLGLERTLAIAACRTVIQLLLIGLVLEWVFAQQNPWVVLLSILFMTVVAGLSASSRLSLQYRWIWIDTCVAMWLSSWLVGIYAVMFVFNGIEPWYGPQHCIPLMGMILGNALNGISLGLDSMVTSIAHQRRLIETRLALGATRWEATRPERQAAVKSGMMPIINSMMIVGLVSLPGMMTGQLLSGTSPVQAVKYQIAIMFLIASATAIGAYGATVLCYLRVTNPAHQLESSRLSSGRSRG